MKTKSFSSGDVRIRDGMSLIEGGLPIPDGMPDISCVLAITGTARLTRSFAPREWSQLKGRPFSRSFMWIPKISRTALTRNVHSLRM